jgi:hypothetical protein
MSTVTVAFGAIMLILGIASYFGTGSVSLTALIPAAFGLLLLILGVIARDPGKRKHAMHFAAMVGRARIRRVRAWAAEGRDRETLARVRMLRLHRRDGGADVDLCRTMCTLIHKCATGGHGIKLFAICESYV